METNSHALTNGDSLLLVEDVHHIAVVAIPLDIDLAIDQVLEKLNSNTMVPSLLVELNTTTGALVHQSATAAYAEYRTFMVGQGKNFRPYNQFLALATPMARVLYARVLETENEASKLSSRIEA